MIFKSLISVFAVSIICKFGWSQAAFEVNGRLLDCGDRLPLVMEPIILTQGDSIVQMVITDDKGQFSFKNISSGNYELEVKYFYYAWQKQTVTVPANKTVDFCLVEGNTDSLLTIFHPLNNYTLYNFGLPIYLDEEMNAVGAKYGVTWRNLGCRPDRNLEKRNSTIRKILAYKNGSDWEDRFMEELERGGQSSTGDAKTTTLTSIAQFDSVWTNPKYDKQIKLAEEALNRGNFSGAHQYYVDAVGIRSTNHARRWERILAALVAEDERQSDRITALMIVADSLYKIGDLCSSQNLCYAAKKQSIDARPDELLKKIRQQIIHCDENGDINYPKIIRKAHSYFTNGEFEKAKLLYQQAILMNQSDTFARYQLEQIQNLQNKK